MVGVERVVDLRPPGELFAKHRRRRVVTAMPRAERIVEGALRPGRDRASARRGRLEISCQRQDRGEFAIRSPESGRSVNVAPNGLAEHESVRNLKPQPKELGGA